MAECHTFCEFIRLNTKEYRLADGLHYTHQEEDGGMPLARITRPGLVSITVLVAVLWSCLLVERRMSRNSRMETYRALRDIRYLKFKRRVEPASQPGAPAPSSRPVVG